MRFLLIVALLLASACSSQQRQATIVVPTLAVLPTETFTPTVTPTNTETRTPTYTLTPSITPSPTLTATFTATNTPIATSTPVATATPECSVARWWSEVEGTVTEFLDTAEVASQTARMSLSSVQLEMRRLQREFEGLDDPPCVNDISRALRNGMDTINDAFGRFAAQNDGVASVYFNLGGEYFYIAMLKLADAAVPVTDYRLLLPWLLFGGDELNEPTATQLAIEDATRGAEIDATINAILTPTATPRVSVVSGVITAIDSVELREGPGVEFQSMGMIAPRTELVVIGRNSDGNWLNVRLPNGQEGWIAADYIEFE